MTREIRLCPLELNRIILIADYLAKSIRKATGVMSSCGQCLKLARGEYREQSKTLFQMAYKEMPDELDISSPKIARKTKAASGW